MSLSCDQRWQAATEGDEGVEEFVTLLLGAQGFCILSGA